MKEHNAWLSQSGGIVDNFTYLCFSVFFTFYSLNISLKKISFNNKVKKLKN